MRALAAIVALACLPACLDKSPYQSEALTVLGDGGQGASEFVIDGEYLYALGNSEGAAVLKCPRAGCATPTVLYEARNDRMSVRIAIDATHVYWTERSKTGGSGGDGKIMRIPKSGSGSAEIFAEESDPCGIAVDQEAVYWTTGCMGMTKAVRRRGKGDATTTDLAALGGTAARIAVDDQYAYWVDQNELWRTPKSQSSPARLSGAGPVLFEQQSAPGLILDGDFVYWVSAADNTIHRTAKGTGEDAWSLGSGGTETIVADDAALYWIMITNPGGSGQDSEGKLMRVDKTSHDPDTLTEGPGIRGVAVDGDYVYWSQQGWVFALPK